jgi:hypothetical protein
MALRSALASRWYSDPLNVAPNFSDTHLPHGAAALAAVYLIGMIVLALDMTRLFRESDRDPLKVITVDAFRPAVVDYGRAVVAR